MMNIRHLINDEYLEFDKEDATDVIKSAKETLKDIKERRKEVLPNYLRVARDDLFDMCLALIKFKELNTKENKEMINQLRNFLKENGGNPDILIQLEV